MAPDRRYELLERLRVHGGVPDTTIELLKTFATFSDYLTKPDHAGGSPMPGKRYFRQDGTEHTFDNVPFKKVLQSVEKRIEDLPEDRRSEVFQKVMAGMPGRKKNPDWEKPVCNPRAEPKYAFSVSRAKSPESIKSNKQILDDLASAADLSQSMAEHISVQIAWWDSQDEKGNYGIMRFRSGVKGGRLGQGRDHTLEDVPNNYVRDRVMDYINVEVSEDKRDVVRSTVFSDLTAEEIEEYSSLVAKERQTDEKHGELPRTDLPKKKKRKSGEDLADEIVKRKRCSPAK